MKKLAISVLLLAVSGAALANENTTPIANETCNALLTEMTTLVNKAKQFTQDESMLANLDRAMAQAENQIRSTPETKQTEECTKATEQLTMLKDAVDQLEQAASTQQ